MPTKTRNGDSKKRVVSASGKGGGNEDKESVETQIETFGEDLESSTEDISPSKPADIVIDSEEEQEVTDKEAEEEEVKKNSKKGKKKKKKKKKVDDSDEEDEDEAIKEKSSKKGKDKLKTSMELTHFDDDSLRDEEDKTNKKTKKTDIKKAFRNFRSKLSSKRKGKNEVQEISIKPETESPAQCWGDAMVKTKHSPSSSRSSSANSKNSKTLESIDDLEDGIEVIYDAAYQGGESE